MQILCRNNLKVSRSQHCTHSLPHRLCFSLALIVLIILNLPAKTQTLSKDDYIKKRGIKRMNGASMVVGNRMYEIVLEDLIGAGVGLYSVRTGPDHRITKRFMNQPQDLLLGASTEESGASYTTIRSYTTKTDYVQTEFATSSSGFKTVWLDTTFISEDSVVAVTDFIMPIVMGTDTTGYRVTYSLPGLAALPDSLEITQVINVHGSNFDDSWVEITTAVKNLDSEPVEIGIRYLWDLIVAGDDGATLVQRTSGISFGNKERRFDEPGFSFFIAAADDSIDLAPPAYHVFGSVLTPACLLPTQFQPQRLQQVFWPFAFFQAFDYEVNPALDVTSKDSSLAGLTGGDNALQFYWGDTSETALMIAPGDSVQVTQVLLAGRPGEVPAIICVDDTSKVLYGIDGDNDHLIRVDLNVPAPAVGILGKVIHSSKSIENMEAMTWDPVLGRIIVISNDDDGPLYLIDPANINGAADIPATLVGPTGSDDIEGIAVNPVTGELFGVDNSSHKLVKISVTAGGVAVADIGDLGFKDVEGLAFTFEPDPVLYGADTRTGKLITIDTATGVSSAVDSDNMIGFPNVEALEFDRDGELFGYSNGTNHQFITVDLQTGIGEVVPVLGTEGLDVEGLTFMLPEALLSSNTLTTITEDKQPSQPVNFNLEQNYPNPFNPTTNIRFQIPDGSTGNRPVQLLIYNLLGELVRILVDEPKANGHYLVEWDGKDENGDAVASGLYFYRLTAGDHALTRRMLMLK